MPKSNESPITVTTTPQGFTWTIRSALCHICVADEVGARVIFVNYMFDTFKGESYSNSEK